MRASEVSLLGRCSVRVAGLGEVQVLRFVGHPPSVHPCPPA